jgi:uncharacterized protein
MDQIVALERPIRRNPNVVAIMAFAGRLNLSSWHLGAGAIAQTVWNELHGFDSSHGMRDYGLVYFDALDLSAEKEDDIEATIRHELGDLGASIDVKNEAKAVRWSET